MEINYWIVIPFTLVVIALIGWLIKRNSKDEKKFEKDSNQIDIKPDQHPDEKI
jgi:hypothetical protein